MEIREMQMEDIEARKAEIKELMNAEDADLDALTTEVDELNERASAIKAEAEKRNAIIEAIVADEGTTIIEERKEDIVMENTITRNSPEYINAYANYIKTNKADECRALLSENAASDGQVAVPDMVLDVVKTAWDNDDVMSQVRKSFIKGNLKVGFEISADGAEIHLEGGEDIDEEELALGIRNLVPASIKKWITISDEAMDLTGEAFLTYIYDEIAHQIAKKAADVLVNDIATSTASGSTSKPAQAVIPAEISLTSVADGIANLSDMASNPVVIINKLTYAKFMALKASANYAQDVFYGCPVIFNNTLVAYDSADEEDVWMIVGDLGYGAQANFPNGQELTFKFDDLSLAEKDLVKIVGREYVALGTVAPKAFAIFSIPEEEEVSPEG